MNETDGLICRPLCRRAGMLVALFATTAALVVEAQTSAPAWAMAQEAGGQCAGLSEVDWWAWQECEQNGGGGGGGSGTAGGSGSAGGGGTAVDNRDYYDESGDDCADYGDCWSEPYDEEFERTLEAPPENLDAPYDPSSGKPGTYYQYPEQRTIDCLGMLQFMKRVDDRIEREMGEAGGAGPEAVDNLRVLRRDRRLRKGTRRMWRNFGCEAALTGGD